MKPEQVTEPSLDLYISFDNLAKTVGATDQARRDKLGSLLVDFASDEEGPEDKENNIIEENGKRYVRWAVAWAASEFSEPGTNPAADKIFDERVTLNDMALPLAEAIALDVEAAKDEKPTRSGRGGRSGGRSSAKAETTDASSENLKDALAGLPAEEGEQASDAPTTEKPTRQRRRTTAPKEEAPEPSTETAAATPARRGSRTAKAPETDDVPSATEMAVQRIQKEVDNPVGMTARSFLEIELAVAEHRVVLLRKALGDLKD